MLIEERVTTVEEALVHYMQVQERELSMFREGVAEIQASAAGVRAEVGEIRESVAEIQASAAGVRAEVGEIRESVAEIQASAAGVRLEVAEIRASNARTDRQLLEMQQQAEKDRQQIEKDRQQGEKDRKDFNKRLAEISDSMGTLIEDMVAPCGTNLAKAIFDSEEAEMVAIRVRRRHPQRRSEMMELDLLAVGPSKILVVEAKRRLDPTRVADYQQKLAPFFEFFPEHADKTLCPAVASVYLDPSVIVFLNRQKIHGIAMGDEVMEVVNLGQF